VDQSRAAFGAYGFRITGVPGLEHHLPQVPADWPELRLATEAVTDPEPEGAQPPGTIWIGEDSAELWLAEAGCVSLTRQPLSIRFATRAPLTPDAILHPFLALPAVIANRWHGRISLHGGAFLHDGVAWAVLGDREAGKSTTLGLLLRGGEQILADDIVVAEGASTFAGPRAVDLREDTAAQVGGEALGVVGNRSRWRMRPDVGPAQAPLGGLIELAWGERVAIEPLGPRQRLQRLIASAALIPAPAAATALLDLAGLPGLRFVRPRRLTGARDAVVRLLQDLPAA
jgi:hypothetical protein